MRKVFLLLALLTLLIAAALRLWQLHVYPPGPHYDEAVEILITRSIAFNGANFFPIANVYQGREALFYYLSAPLFQLIGDSPFTLRIANVFCNLITIAASLALGRAMIKGERGVVVGLAMGVMMALSFPLIWLSRQAFRTGPLPMLQALALLFLWRGLNACRRAWIWLVLAGFFAGAALYTYMASRLFPLWLLIGGLGLLVLDARQRLRRLRQGLLFFTMLAITAAPMAIYAIQNPDIFLRRLSEVTTGAEAVTLPESVRLHLEMFFIHGDPYLRYNIPGRPYFTSPEGLLLLTGIAVAVVRLARPGCAPERAAYWLALLSPLMVIPSVISVGGLPPNHMRSVGMVPLIFVLTATGFEWIFCRVTGRCSPVSHPRALASVAIVTLAVGGVLVGRAYFDWAGRADLFYEADADIALAARWLPSHVDSDTLVYVASRHVEHPTLMAGWDGPVTWIGLETLFRPPPGKSALVIFAHNDPPSPDWAAWLAPYTVSDVPSGPDGGPAFSAYRIPPDADLPPSAQLPSETVQNGLATLIGIKTPVITAGDQGEVVMQWRVERPPAERDLTPYLQLEDQQGTVLYRTETYLVQTDRWRPGEVMLHRMTVHVPPGTPPGQYPVRLTWVYHDSGVYVPYIDESGAISGVWAKVGQVDVQRPAVFPDSSVLKVDHAARVDVSPGLRLLGWNSFPTTIRPGETLKLTLFWQALPFVGETRPNLAMTTALREGQNETTIYSGPLAANYPSDQWVDGELVAAPMYWPISREQPPGSYDLRLRAGETVIDLGMVDVAGVPRLFEPPLVDHVVEAHLGESLGLYGYSLQAADSVQLDLVWRAFHEVNEDYTVFVHVLDASGAIVSQFDLMPQNNTYPTSLWVAGEYVPDRYVFADLRPGEYHLRVGLYLQSNGTRLRVGSGAGEGDFIEIGPVELDSAG